MSSKVLVAYVKHTGHILAALTRVSDPSGSAHLDQIVTPELRVRLLDSATTVGPPGAIEFAIPQDELGTIVVDKENDLLKKPRTFKLADPSQPSSTLEKLPAKGADFASIPTTGQIPESIITVTTPSPVTAAPPKLQQNQLVVTMAYRTGNPPPDKSTPVWAMIKRSADSYQVVSSAIDPKALTVTIPLLSPVTVGDSFDLLILAGRSPIFAKSVVAVA